MSLKDLGLSKNWGSSTTKSSPFRAFEVLHADALMNAKMYLEIFGYLFFGQVILTGLLSWFILPRIGLHVKFKTLFSWLSIVYLAVPFFLVYLQKKNSDLMAKDHIRGPQLLSEESLIASLTGETEEQIKAQLETERTGKVCPPVQKSVANRFSDIAHDLLLKFLPSVRADAKAPEVKEPSIIKIGNVPLPLRFEPEHMLIVGKTRVGKSVLANQILEKLVGKKAIVLDIQNEYIPKWYDPTRGDIIFNILDERSVKWSPFNEARTRQDVEALWSTIIPDAKGGGSNEQFFNDAARAVGIAAHHLCIQSGKETNKALAELVFTDAELLHGCIENVKAGRRGAAFLAQPTSNMAGSVMAVLTQYCSWMDYMETEGDFSFIDWLTDGKPGFLFIASSQEVERVLRPVISVAFDLVGRKIGSLPPRQPEDRCYLFIDEWGALQRLSSMHNMLTRGGSKWFIVIVTTQDVGQIKETYGDNLTETMLNSFGTFVVLKLTSPTSAKWASERLGEEEFWEQQETVSMKSGDQGDGRSITRQKRKEPLLSPSEIMYMKKLEYCVQIPDHDPAFGKLLIKPVNNMPTICESFIMRSGLSLNEVYSRNAEIEHISQERGLETVYDSRQDEPEIDEIDDIDFEDSYLEQERKRSELPHRIEREEAI